MPFRLIKTRTNIPFMAWRGYGFVASGFLVLASVILFLAFGLNYGIDFRGGILMEVATGDADDIAEMRGALGGLGLGEVSLQEFGAADLGDRPSILVRIERQPGGETAQNEAIAQVRATLDALYGDEIDYRRQESVGPKVGAELILAGVQAVAIALAAMLVYIWFRFEWQFAVGAVVALIHDVTATIGVFALVGLEFNLATVAAILLIVGYSMNDTVVVYDRVRENLRKYKALALVDLLSRSINDTLSRTLMTSVTTLLALVALWALGGPVIRDFCFAMVWGVFVGTYSSIFIAAPLLILFGLEKLARRDSAGGSAEAQTPAGGQR